MRLSSVLFPEPGRSDDRHEIALAHGERDAVDRAHRRRAGILLDDARQRHHGAPGQDTITVVRHATTTESPAAILPVTCT